MADAQRKKELIAAYKARPVMGSVCAIRNTVTGRTLLLAALNPKAQHNRFLFSVAQNSCVFFPLQSDWAQHGPAAFSFEFLEDLEKGPEQTDRAYREDLDVLLEAWKERLTQEGVLLYN